MPILKIYHIFVSEIINLKFPFCVNVVMWLNLQQLHSKCSQVRLDVLTRLDVNCVLTRLDFLHVIQFNILMLHDKVMCE